MNTQGGVRKLGAYRGPGKSLGNMGRSWHGGHTRPPCSTPAHRPCSLALFISPMTSYRFAVLKGGHPPLKSPMASKGTLLPPPFLPQAGTPVPEGWEGGEGTPLTRIMGKGPHIPTTEPITLGAVHRRRNQESLRCWGALLFSEMSNPPLPAPRPASTSHQTG